MSDLLTPDDLTQRYEGTTRGVWAQHRYRGTGPAYIKVGRSVFYRREDIEAWEKSLVRTRTDNEAA